MEDLKELESMPPRTSKGELLSELEKMAISSELGMRLLTERVLSRRDILKA